MAEPENKATEERVELYVPRGNDDDPNLFIGINGVNYILPRGKKSMVPKHVYDEYWRSQEAQNKADDTIDKLSAAAKF